MGLSPFAPFKPRPSSQLPHCSHPSSHPVFTNNPHQTAQPFNMVLKGHCLCKAVTYTVDVDQPLITGYDHCDDCQRQSGSTYCKSHLFTLGVDLARSGWVTGSLGVLVVVIAGRESAGPHPRPSYTDGSKLLRDPCHQARATPQGRICTVRPLS